MAKQQTAATSTATSTTSTAPDARPAPQVPYTPFSPGTRAGSESGQSAFVNQLRRETAAVRLTYSKFGIRRAIKGEPVARMAAVVGAESGNVNASKRLLDTTNDAWRAAIGAIGRARAHWRAMTVPYPVKGIRLIRKELVDSFDDAMRKFAAELAEGLEQLRDAYGDLRTAAREQLGELFNAADYPEDIGSDFLLEWEYPPVEPPNYLKELNPALYAAAQERLEARFEEAARMAEDAFAAELKKLVTHLCDRLSGGDDGKKKRLNESALKNISEFLEGVRSKRVTTGGELDKLIDAANRAVSGISVGELRQSDDARRVLSEQMSQVRTSLDAMLEARPERSITLDDE